MIPKIIHYCWFGNNQKPSEIIECIESWKKLCPDFSIIEWNESNFHFNNYPFSARMHKEKRWAFVADYARLHILYEQGGFYLDTDMMLLQSISPLSKNECVLGEEEVGIISAGMIGAIPNHPFILDCKKYYDNHDNELITIPRVLSQVFENYENKKSLTVLPPKTFYPFDSNHIKEWHGQDLGKDVYGVHLWNYSWGSPINKFFKKIGIYNIGVKIADLLGVKKLLKKILGLI